MIQFNGHFDGENICPDEPLSLPEGVTLRVTVDEVRPSGDGRDREPANAQSPAELFAKVESEHGLVDGPEDWSAEHAHYLFEAPKRIDGHSK